MRSAGNLDGRLQDVLRAVASLFLVAVAAFAGLVAYGALQNVFASYRDSTVATYLGIGLPALGICALALTTLYFLWRRR